MNIRFRHVLMEGEPGAGGGGTAPAPAPAASPAGAPAAAPAGQPGDAAASALSAGNEWSFDSVPEKYRVKNDAGEIDHLATLRKVDEARGSLERRMGAGDIRPKSADEYKLPENDLFKSMPLDEAQSKAFREKAHGWGLSQAQYESVMNEYAAMVPKLVEGAAALDASTAIEALRGTWKDEFDANMRGAFRAVNSVAEKAGLDFAEVEKAIGNNPVAIRLFAALSKEMGEDKTPSAAGGTGGQTSIDDLMRHPAYMDAKHPEHAAVSKRIADYFAKQPATA